MEQLIWLNINTLSESQQTFFTKLYSYKIIDNCNHKQIRPFKIDFKDKKKSNRIR